MRTRLACLVSMRVLSARHHVTPKPRSRDLLWLVIISWLGTSIALGQPLPVQIGPPSIRGENPLDMRAGVRAELGPAPLGSEQVLLSGRAEIGNVCGFDMLASLLSRLNELPSEMLEMLQSVLFGLPFTLLCQMSPSACNTYKQMQSIANFDLRAIQRDCQQVASRSMAYGMAARDDAQGLCFREGLAQGRDPENLWEACTLAPSALTGPNGAQGATVSVLGEVLGRTGLPEERQARIRGVFGDLVLSVAGGGVSTQTVVDGNYSIRHYSEHLEARGLEIESAVQAARAGAPLPTLVVAGHPLPGDAIRNIALEPNDEIRQLRAQRLASALALQSTLYELIAAQEDFASALAASDMPHTQRQMMQQQLQINRERIALLEKRLELSRGSVGPVVMDEAREYLARQKLAGQMGATVSPETAPVHQFEGGASSMGYPQ